MEKTNNPDRVLAETYIMKIYELCKEKNVTLHLIPNPKKDIPERDLADETPLIEAEKKATKEEEQTVSEKKLSEKQEEKVSLEVQQQMDDTEKEQATKKKAASIPAHSLLPYIQETVNGIRSIKDFNVEAKK